MKLTSHFQLIAVYWNFQMPDARDPKQHLSFQVGSSALFTAPFASSALDCGFNRVLYRSQYGYFYFGVLAESGCIRDHFRSTWTLLENCEEKAG